MSKAIEEFLGPNEQMVRYRLGHLHVGLSFMEACRYARPRNMRSVDPALRRGWVLCVGQVWREFQEQYTEVMYRRPLTKSELSKFPRQCR